EAHPASPDADRRRHIRVSKRESHHGTLISSLRHDANYLFSAITQLQGEWRDTMPAPFHQHSAPIFGAPLRVPDPPQRRSSGNPCQGWEGRALDGLAWGGKTVAGAWGLGLGQIGTRGRS